MTSFADLAWMLACSAILNPASGRQPAARPVVGVVQPGVLSGRATVQTGVRESVTPMDRPVTLRLLDVSLADAVREINVQANLHLNYSDRILPAGKRVTLVVVRIPAKDALSRVLRGTGVEVRQTATGDLFLDRQPEPPPQTSTPDTGATGAVRGSVRDTTSGDPVAGAVVTTMIEGITHTSTTRDDGLYSLQGVPAGVRKVTVRYIGYQPATHTVLVVAGRSVREDFFLHERTALLNRVVTTATGQKRLYELATSVTILNVDSIVTTHPISNVTDLLEGRVPGLVVQHSSGVPGDPSRLRLRGVSSANESNDPIVIVDGVRVYYGASDSTALNISSPHTGGVLSISTCAGCIDADNSIGAPSPLDQIDPNTIQTIEIFKGPSASTMYGPDAANGVIVITTKHGTPGKARWTASASRGVSFIPNKYSTGYYAWGHTLAGNAQVCNIKDVTCTVDSLVKFQALNDPRFTALGKGDNTNLSLGVSGGVQELTYAFTGSVQDEMGLVRLPEREIAIYQQRHGAAPPNWMQRPDQHSRWSGSGRLVANISPKLDASLTSTLTRENQQRSALDQSINWLTQTYASANGQYYNIQPGGNVNVTSALLPNFYQGSSDKATNFTNAANINWRLRPWFSAMASAGVNVISRNDQTLLPRDMITVEGIGGGPSPRTLANKDSAGLLRVGSFASMQSTLHVQGTATAPLPRKFHYQVSLGANHTRSSYSVLATGVTGLAAGTSSINGAATIDYASQTARGVTSYGWYVDQSIGNQRLIFNAGLRVDGSSAFGANAKTPVFPKFGVSYLASGERWFPLKQLFDVFRARIAYGRAGVWPGPSQKLRLYATSRPWLDSGFVDATQLRTVGNSTLRPERSSEIEGGFDAGMFGDRLSMEFTGYRKMRYDAVMAVSVAPSVYGNGVSRFENIGEVRNTGLELSTILDVVRSDPVSWSMNFNLSRNRNLVVKLAPDVQPFSLGVSGRVVAGYPLFGFWAKPLLGYADANGDGRIGTNEVQVGDTAVYMGPTLPNFLANAGTNLSLFRGALWVTANFQYENGMTQYNLVGNGVLSRANGDPSRPLSEQAYVVTNDVHNFALERANLLRFSSLSIAYHLSRSVAQRMGASALSMALEGTNLRLWTNYAQGMDPNVNAVSVGNDVVDNGFLPTPRTWRVTVRANY